MSLHAPDSNQPSASAEELLPPYGRILVPLNGSPLVEEALPPAVALVERAGKRGTLILVRVSQHTTHASRGLAPDAEQAEEQETAEAYLKRVTEAVASLGLPVERVTLEGEPACEIVQVAHQHAADLIVMTTHARGDSPCWWQAGVAEQVLQHARVPLFLFKHGTRIARLFSPHDQPQILVPVDGTALVQPALHSAAMLAKQIQATVTLLYVVEAPPLVLHGRGRAGDVAGGLRSAIRAERRAVAEYLKHLQPFFQTQGINTAMSITQGEVDGAIIEQAEMMGGPDKPVLLVMATHGRTGIERWFRGSVANKVLRLADLPVVLVGPVAFARQHVLAAKGKISLP